MKSFVLLQFLSKRRGGGRKNAHSPNAFNSLPAMDGGSGRGRLSRVGTLNIPSIPWKSQRLCTFFFFEWLCGNCHGCAAYTCASPRRHHGVTFTPRSATTDSLCFFVVVSFFFLFRNTQVSAGPASPQSVFRTTNSLRASPPLTEITGLAPLLFFSLLARIINK